MPTVIPVEVEVREFYNDYSGPKYAPKVVRKLLSTVPHEYLRGLDCVVLTDMSGQPRRRRQGKLTTRNRRVTPSRVRGYYHQAFSGQQAWIELFVDKIVPGMGRGAWISIARETVFGDVLFHEIGHHIEATIRPEYCEKEDVADQWRKVLLKGFLRRKYWFLFPVLVPLAMVFSPFTRRLQGKRHE